MANPNFQYFHGAANVRWALGSTTYTVSGMVGIYQSSDVEQQATRQEIHDQRGTVVSTIDFDPKKTAIIELYVSDSNTPNAGNAAINYPYPGVMVTITADSTDPANATNWIPDSVAIKSVINDATKITFKATLYPQVTV